MSPDAVRAEIGAWQLRRLAWKEERLAEWNARIDQPPLGQAALLAGEEDLTHRRGTVRGSYDHEQAILVTRVPRENREGVRLMTPLRLEGSPDADDARAVLVDRGWIPYRDVAAVLEQPGPTGPVEVTGLHSALAAALVLTMTVALRESWSPRPS